MTDTEVKRSGIAGGDTRLQSPLTRAGRRALRLTGCASISGTKIGPLVFQPLVSHDSRWARATYPAGRDECGHHRPPGLSLE